MPSIKVMLDTLREVKLSESEIDTIIEEAERILSETLAAHELFVASDRQLPQDTWKFMKTKEHVRVYSLRSRKKATTSTSANKSHPSGITARTSSKDDDDCRSRSLSIDDTLLGAFDFPSLGAISITSESSTSGEAEVVPIGSTSTSSGNSSTAPPSVHNSNSLAHRGDGQRSTLEEACVELNRTKPAHRPLVIATGTIAGTVDDVAFGMLAHTERLWRHRDAHLGAEYAASKILATITRPTPQSPFNSLTVRWNIKTLGALMRRRDKVFIEANGVAIGAGGERVAYNLVHSLDILARIPGFKHLDVVRVNVSTCYLARQHDKTSVEVFCRGFLIPGGNLEATTTESIYADVVLCIVHAVDCAYVKKLVWLADQKQGQCPASTARRSPPSRCEHCFSSFSSLSNLFSSSASCLVCKREVCGKCSVEKKVAVDTKDGAAKMKSTMFCVPCVVEATRAPPVEVAVKMLGLDCL